MSAIRIDDVIVGERRRQDMGDVATLAASLQRFGLIHPIVIDGANHLVCGGRRLDAAKRLGWEEIEARVRWELSPEELRELELEENLQRKDLTEIELSREMVRKAKAIAPAISAQSTEKAPQGRKPTYEAPREDVAQAIGASEPALRKAEQHVAAVERYPELEPLAQQPAIESAKALDALPEPERETTRATLQALPATERRQVGPDIIGTLALEPDAGMSAAIAKRQYTAAMKQIAGNLTPLHPDAIAPLLSDGDWLAAEIHRDSVQDWFGRLFTARVAGLRLVERETDDDAD